MMIDIYLGSFDLFENMSTVESIFLILSLLYLTLITTLVTFSQTHRERYYDIWCNRHYGKKKLTISIITIIASTTLAICVGVMFNWLVFVYTTIFIRTIQVIVFFIFYNKKTKELTNRMEGV